MAPLSLTSTVAMIPPNLLTYATSALSTDFPVIFNFLKPEIKTSALEASDLFFYYN